MDYNSCGSSVGEIAGNIAAVSVNSSPVEIQWRATDKVRLRVNFGSVSGAYESAHIITSVVTVILSIFASDVLTVMHIWVTRLFPTVSIHRVFTTAIILVCVKHSIMYLYLCLFCVAYFAANKYVLAAFYAI